MEDSPQHRRGVVERQVPPRWCAVFGQSVAQEVAVHDRRTRIDAMLELLHMSRIDLDSVIGRRSPAGQCVRPTAEPISMIGPSFEKRVDDRIDCFAFREEFCRARDGRNGR
ncbi:hypothetical protein GS495_25275 [Rhodococcus hoagii]|nr:hypothetical protein [Prescottella equi]